MIMGLLAELHRSHRLTSIYVTHNLSFAKRCDRILKLEGGSLLEAMPAGESVSLQGGNSYV
jgi:lipoprotein-releasing system ATP-binding protein